MESQKCIVAKYTVAIEVAKSPNEVFNHLINEVSKFWPEDLDGETTKLNDEFVFRSGDRHYSKNKVVEFVPNKRLVWLVTESLRKTDNFAWTGTKMIFDLINKGDGTLLKFTYDGVTLEDEYERLVQVCDMVIKEKLYNLLIDGNTKSDLDRLEMANENYSVTIEVAKSPQDIFNCIKEVPKWWNKEDFEGSSSKLDDEFVICHPGGHYSKQKLVEVVPDKKVVWLVTDSKLDWLEKDMHEWTNTKMIFEITAKGDQTVLHFTHEGLIPEKECYAMCEQGWDMVIKDRLLNFIATGKTI